MTAATAEFTTLDIQIRGQVGTIWMDRPDVYNAFDETLIAELGSACAQLENTRDVRVVVLAGRGKHFSAGADLNWMKRAARYTDAQNLEDARRFARMLHRLATLSKPTVARVHGAALGGGTGLAAACDVVVAAADAVFSTSEVRFGIIPSVISPYVLRAIGPRHALRYFQSAERFDATTAHQIGLVHLLAETGALDAEVDAMVERLMVGGPGAQAAAKQLVFDIHSRAIDEKVVEETAQRISRQRSTSEAREGISAFLDGRKPDWLV